MQLQPAQRKRAKIKMGLQGPSGSGKTMSSLLIAFGLCGDWNKIAVVDTENNSSNLYAHLGTYNVLSLSAPFTPEKYIQAMELSENAGVEVIILDSVTHEWENLLDFHSSLTGNSFTNWSKITPRHNDFVQKILQLPCHFISTIRTKQDYVLTEVKGKITPEKVGLKSIQRDGLDYEFTLVFDLDIKNFASASKDRTGLFFGKPQQVITVAVGQQIAAWCNAGVIVTVDEVSKRINDTISIKDLLFLYQQYPEYKATLQKEYEDRKRHIILQQLEPIQPDIINPQTFSENGVH